MKTVFIASPNVNKLVTIDSSPLEFHGAFQNSVTVVATTSVKKVALMPPLS